MKTSVLFLMGKYPNYGGVERVTTVMANELVKRCYNVGIVSFEQTVPELAEKELNPTVSLYKLYYPVLNKRNVARLHKILVECDYDVIISQWVVPWYVARLCRRAMRGTDCRLVSVHHNDPTTNFKIKAVEMDIDARKGNPFVNRLKLLTIKNLSRLSLRLTYQWSDRYIVLSESYKETARKYMWLTDTSKMLCITNPVTIGDLNDKSESPVKQKEIIYVGRIEYNQKRCFRLLEIWQRLQNRLPDWHFTIVGDGPDRADMEQRIAELRLQRVEMMGFTNPLEYYQRASALLLVSDYEGFGLVLTECMKYGVVPFVVGSYSTVFDIIDDKINGCILPIPYDADTSTEILYSILSNASELNAMSRKAMEKSESFSVTTIVDKWEQLFRNLKQRILYQITER